MSISCVKLGLGLITSSGSTLFANSTFFIYGALSAKIITVFGFGSLLGEEEEEKQNFCLFSTNQFDVALNEHSTVELNLFLGKNNLITLFSLCMEGTSSLSDCLRTESEKNTCVLAYFKGFSCFF